MKNEITVTQNEKGLFDSYVDGNLFDTGFDSVESAIVNTKDLLWDAAAHPQADREYEERFYAN